MSEYEYDIIVIGAGAAGLFFCHQMRNKKILLIDHNDRVGKKILISGGGRCNFTNIHSNPTDFVSQNPHFCKSALHRFSPYDFIDLVERQGITYFEKKLGQLFCERSAKDIINLLLKGIDQKLVDIKLGESVTSVDRINDKYHLTLGENSYSCFKLIIASGGLSLPSIGASAFGHEIAKQFGHKIIPCEPALVPFKYPEYSELSGISCLAKVKVNGHIIHEDLLFTHKGFSGPAILKISLFWNSGEEISFDFLPDHTLEDFAKNKNIEKTLKEILPGRLVDTFTPASLKSMNWGDLNKGQFAELELHYKKFAFIPQGTEGFRKAEVTRGGVDTRKVSSKTMESQLSPGLYFIGEVLDVTGQLGGHNFQWAWASAHAAALALR